MSVGKPEGPPAGRAQKRQLVQVHWRVAVIVSIVGLLIYCEEYRPDAIDLATAPYRFNPISWELGNLPDKWLRRAGDSLRAPFRNDGASRAPANLAEVNEYFDQSRLIWEIDRQLIRLAALPSVPDDLATGAAELRQGQARLRVEQTQLRPRVEETLELAVADTLQAQGFQARILSQSVGVFPPVDTVLTGSPTVLITSPRDRIERGDGVVLQTGLTNDQREAIETAVEAQTDLSALVVNTGGIAFYPSITLPHGGLDFALEVIAHEWVHQWLWFRPLGRRYFEGGELTAINETVANIAGREIGAMARHRMEETAPAASDSPSLKPAGGNPPSANEPPPFDFQAEMRTTRLRVDELLAAGDVAGAEAYMEERRREFVANGYHIRRLNQAYFAFHGTYADTGAAGVSVIGQQVAELRRRSPSLHEFLHTAAQIENPAELADYLANPAR